MVAVNAVSHHVDVFSMMFAVCADIVSGINAPLRLYRQPQALAHVVREQDHSLIHIALRRSDQQDIVHKPDLMMQEPGL